jgi:ribose transport system substrate-binding protein
MVTALRFVIVPKVAHPWFDEVNKGAQAEAEILSSQGRASIMVEYLPPATAGTAEQNAVLERVVATRPDGVAVDPVDALHHMTAIQLAAASGIRVVLFDSPSPNASLTSVGNDFSDQGFVAAARLVNLIAHSGKVAIMQGYPSAPNHRQRYEAQLEVLREHPGVTIVDGGIDNDDIDTARRQASAVLETNPDLSGYLCCDAAGPIGIAAALREAGKVGQVKVVGMDALKPTLDAIKEGVIDSSAATKPRMQGAMSVLMLWQASLGVQLPQAIDTGIDMITRENVDQYLAAG